MDILTYESYSLSRLGKLRYYLKYEISASFLYLMSYFGGILLILASAAAVIFIPFMLNVLIKEKKFGWILTFILIIGIPLAFAIILKEIIFLFVALALFISTASS